ncbi:6417_t:CDS:1, partial [Gigaspora rosea]
IKLRDMDDKIKSTEDLTNPKNSTARKHASRHVRMNALRQFRNQKGWK